MITQKALKEFLKAKDWKSLLRALPAFLGERDPDALLWAGKILEKVPAVEFGLPTKRIAVLGGYTTSFTVPALRAALFLRGLRAELWECDYGLLEQTILSADEALKEFKPDLCFFSVGSEHLGHATWEEEAARWEGLWKKCHDTFAAQVLQNTFAEPVQRTFGNFELKNPRSRTRFIRALNLSLAERAPSYVHFADVDFQASLYGRREWQDVKYYDLAKLSVAQTHLVHEAENAAAVIAALFGRAKKCLVLDLDNTLWGGVVGDDGLAGIKIGAGSDAGEAFARFQRFILSLKDRGVILAVCSKNEEANAKEPFEKRPEMILRLGDISCFVANWEPKHTNIQRIAAELNIGLDSMVFADDNPAEREIVRRHLPEVAIVPMPEDPAYYTEALAQPAYFEAVAVTAEDLARTQEYQANQARASLVGNAGSYEDYLKSLLMRAEIGPFDEAHLPRITQLANKTNQFNLTTRRYTEGEMRAVMENPRYLTLYVKLQDRFGDSGLIALMIAAIDGNAAEIETLLMSCRVLKRDVERFLMNHMVSALKERGIEHLYGTYLPTAKNGLVKDLLPSLGFVPAEAEGRYKLSINDALANKKPTFIQPQ